MRYRAIKTGMKYSEVEEIMGRPPGNYEAAEIYNTIPSRSSRIQAGTILLLPQRKRWIFSDCTITVETDARGFVVSKSIR
jgi:hypothetical protein